MVPVWLAPEVWVWLQLLLPEGLEASRSGLLVLVFWLPNAGGVSGSHTPVGVATPGSPSHHADAQHGVQPLDGHQVGPAKRPAGVDSRT